MMHHLIAILLLISSTTTFASDTDEDLMEAPIDDTKKEVLLSGEIKSGGFGGPVIKLTRLHDANGVLVGGQGGWIINQQFVIGGAGYGLSNKIVRNNQRATLGYGGVLLQYYLFPSKLFQVSFSTLLAGGSAGFLDYQDYRTRNEEPIFVFEPEAALVMNVTRFARMSLGAGYRACVNASDFSGFSTALMVQFGSGM